MVLRTFDTDKEIYQNFKEICSRKYLNIGETLTELIENYVKEKGSKSESSNQKESKVIPVPDFFSEDRLWRKYMGSNREIYSKCAIRIQELTKITDQVHMRYGY